MIERSVHECFKNSSLDKIISFSSPDEGSQGELIGRPSVRPQFQRSSPLKPLGQSKPNFMWSILRRGTKVNINHLGHMTKMAAMPIYGKNHKNIFVSGTGRPISTKLGM